MTVTENRSTHRSNDASGLTAYLCELCNVRPVDAQLGWYELEAYAFIHFGMNTFTDREWGTGDESERLFSPSELDCDQWVSAIKAAGLKGMVLTAKHHDGFCLWPSKYTEHSVKNAAIQIDVVKEAADACRRGGIRFGFYLSPWDRNCPLYGTDAYNDYFCAQLEELLTGYGDIFCVWFDNACGEGPDGRKQLYDFPRYIRMIRDLQPGAVIFNDFGPDIRWCGNEAGSARRSEWAVVPSELCRYAPMQTGPGPLHTSTELDYLYNDCEMIGDLVQTLHSRGMCFVPAEVDTSIRPGWFWHPDEEPKSCEELLQIYMNSVGHNACLHLNIPPDRRGKIDDRDVKSLAEFGTLIRETFGDPIAAYHPDKQNNYPAACAAGDGRLSGNEVSLTIPAETAVRYVALRENIASGQRIEAFRILGITAAGDARLLYQGTTVGNRQICELWTKDTAVPEQLTELTVQVLLTRGEPVWKSIEVFGSKGLKC